MKALRNLTALLLCGLLFYNSMGYMFVYSVMRSNLKKQVFAEIAKLPDASLIAIKLPKGDNSNTIIKKNRHEIIYNGQLFDVVKMKASTDSITYFCVRDKKEEQLIRKISLVNQTSENDKPLRKTASHIIDHLITIALLNNPLRSVGFSLVIKHFLFNYPDYPAPALNITVPPPQICA